MVVEKGDEGVKERMIVRMLYDSRYLVLLIFPKANIQDMPTSKLKLH